MAQFRGTIQGQRGKASRLGTKKSGLRVTCRGWSAGVTCEAIHTEEGDRIIISSDGGSNGHGASLPIATVCEDRIIWHNGTDRIQYLNRGE